MFQKINFIKFFKGPKNILTYCSLQGAYFCTRETIGLGDYGNDVYFGV